MKYLFAILVFFSSPVFAASFDCNKATTKQEKMICLDADLNKLDTKMGYLYEEARAFDQEFIKNSQRNFIKEYKKCNSKENCSSLLKNRNAVFDSYIREYSANPGSCKFAKKIILAVQNNDINSLIDLMPKELGGDSPRKKDMRDKNLRDFFTDKWIVDISESLCGEKMGDKGYMISSGIIWYYNNHDKWEIIAMNDYSKKQKVKNEIPIEWNYKGKLLRSECFYLTWMSWDAEKEYYQKYSSTASNPRYPESTFKDFVKNPGRYFNFDVVVSQSQVTGDYANTLVIPMKYCLSKNSQKVEIKDGEVLEIVRDSESNSSSSEYYRVIKKIDNNLCQKLAPYLDGKCLESNLVDRRSNGGGTLTEHYAIIYGIFKLKNGEEYILPLKIFDSGNDGLNYLDSLPAN